MTSKSSLLVKAVISNIYVDKKDPSCPSRYMHLRVYDTVEALRNAAVSYDRRLGYNTSAESLAEAAGVFQPTEFREFIYKDGTREDRTGRFMGVMRLAKDQLDGETITHESVHAALQAWRMHKWMSDADMVVSLDSTCGPIEESFAYLVGGIAGEVANAVFELSMKVRKSTKELTTV